MKREPHFPSQQLQQDTSHAGLSVIDKRMCFKCDKETVVFMSNNALQLNRVYEEEFTLTNTTGEELNIEFYTAGFREPHEITFAPNYCIRISSSSPRS